MDYPPLVFQFIGSSILALLLLSIVYASFLLSQRLFGSYILSYIFSTLTLVIIVFITLLILEKKFNDYRLAPRDFLNPEYLVREIVISVLMVVSFIGARLITQSLKKRLHRPFELTFQEILGQVGVEKIENTHVVEVLRSWIKEKNIATPIEIDKLMDFFAEKYWDLYMPANSRSLEDSLKVCRIGIEYPPMERELVLYSIDYPEQEPRSISLDDHEYFNFLDEKLKNDHGFVYSNEKFVENDFLLDEKRAVENIEKLSEKA